MSNTIAVSDAAFEAEVLQSDTPVLVDFWAEWCGPCKMLAPIVDEIASETSGSLKVVKVDTEANPRTPVQYEVRGIPTLVLIKDGKEIDRFVGYAPKKALLNKIQPHLTATAGA